MRQYQFIQIACLFLRTCIFYTNCIFFHRSAYVIPFTDDKYSIGDIPISFLNCLEKYCTDP